MERAIQKDMHIRDLHGIMMLYWFFVKNLIRLNGFLSIQPMTLIKYLNNIHLKMKMDDCIN